MSDMPTQVVRTLRHGEFAPAYSTAELLLGVHHFVSPPSGGCEGLQKAAIERARKKSIEARQKRAVERFLGNYQTVKEMLANSAENKEIAAALGVSLATIGNYIAKSTELQALSKARCNYRPPRMGSTTTDSRRRFLQLETAIREELKDDAMWVVAKRFGFDHRTLKQHLGIRK